MSALTQKIFPSLLYFTSAWLLGVLQAQVPDAWLSQDIGTVQKAGTTSYSAASDAFTMQGSGSDIWGTADAFHFVYQPLSGDGVLVVQVTSQSNTNAWAKFGLMLRDGTVPGARNVFWAVTPGNGLTWQNRSITSGPTVNKSLVGQTAPVWLKLQRQGTVISGFWSLDGLNWNLFSATDLGISGNVEVGLALTSHNNSTLGLGCATGLSLQSGSINPLPADWRVDSIGSPVLCGLAGYGSGIYSLQAAGADVWGSSDQFEFVHKTESGNWMISAKVSSLQAANSWSKAGLMVRDSADPAAANVFMATTGANGVVVQRRNTPGAATTSFKGPPWSAPVWVKLERSGSLFICSTSQDGESWTVIDTETLSLPDTVQVGPALTGHNTGTYAQAMIEQVQVDEYGLFPPPTVQVSTPWQSTDIGAVVKSGYAGYDSTSGMFVLHGSGADIWGTADAFHYVSQNLSGDGELMARVDTLLNISPWTKTGLMFRSSTDSAATNVFLAITPGNGVTLQTRKTNGATAVRLFGLSGKAPQWLRLRRLGNTFIAWSAPDGGQWNLLGTASISMPLNLLAGMALTSHNAGQLAAAGLDQVSLQNYSANNPPPDGLPEPWLYDDVGAVSVPGFVSCNITAQTWLVEASGSDVWNTADSFGYVHAAANGDSTLLVRLDSLDSVNDWTKAGLMFRTSTDSNAANVAFFATPSGRLTLQVRNAIGASTTAYYTSGFVFPIWLRLDKTSTGVNASYSSDGSTWTLFRSIAEDTSALVVGGLAVTSHSNGKLAGLYAAALSLSCSGSVDSDHNGLPDAWEMRYFGHLGVDPYADADGDGLSNLQEFQMGTDPLNPDTDGDHILDGLDLHPLASDPGDPPPVITLTFPGNAVQNP